MRNSLPFFIAGGVVLLLAVAGPALSYNRFVSQRNLIRDSWADVGTELQRRHDLIPNLVETVKGYAKHEKELLEQVTAARAAAESAAGLPAERARTENALTGTLRQMFGVVERYPVLKASENFLALQNELAITEDRIQAARRFYNNNVRDYNTRVQSFPSSIVAQMGNFAVADFFEVEPAVRDAPSVTP